MAVTADGVAVGEGFAEVVTVADYSDDNAVLNAAETLPGGTGRAQSWRWPKSMSYGPPGCVTSSACPDWTRSLRRPTATRS